jgi:hypothetical protein
LLNCEISVFTVDYREFSSLSSRVETALVELFTPLKYDQTWSDSRLSAETRPEKKNEKQNHLCLRENPENLEKRRSLARR